jgi:hypothetical protein
VTGRRFSGIRPGAATWSAAIPRRQPLAAGKLRALVLAHLRAHPGLDFSPAELANVLERRTSRGAIARICQRLVHQGLAHRTRETPQRYQAVPPA